MFTLILRDRFFLFQGIQLKQIHTPDRIGQHQGIIFPEKRENDPGTRNYKGRINESGEKKNEAEEEKKIRDNPEERTTDLLKQVFGS